VREYTINAEPYETVEYVNSFHVMIPEEVLEN